MDSEISHQNIVHRSAEELAAGYSKTFRKIEIAALLVYHVVTLALVIKLAKFYIGKPIQISAIVFLGLITADFVSGFVHWAGDTWGSPDWPIIGQTMIRTFREHHVDQLAITRHDFVETNATNCLISLPVLLICWAIPLHQGQIIRPFVVSWMVSMTTWVYATNQIHKWSHQAAPSRFVRLLQKTHLILGAQNHSIHHAPPYAKYYCITTGWLNLPLDRIGFFPKLETLITKLTGAIPREDDIGKTAATETLIKEEKRSHAVFSPHLDPHQSRSELVQ